MADTSIKCDVAIVGSGFAGSFIANELSQKGVKVVMLEAGPGVQPNFNAFMKNFYEANAKVPESPYPPAVLSGGKLIDPKHVAAGRPSALTTGGHSWKDPSQAYLDQSTSKLPFKSTYDRLAGGTSHWMGLTPRMVPNDFRMKTAYGQGQANFPLPDWPIGYQTIEPFYEKAEAELGVAADVTEQHFAGMTFSAGYAYPMPKMPPSMFDKCVAEAVKNLPDAETRFLGMGRPVTSLKVVSQPAARNSQSYRNRRACAGNTNCIPICPIQAKYDPTITLNEATNHGTRLIDHAVANEILLENDRVSGINFITYAQEGGPKIGAGRLEATIYVIAANGIETPRLLLMSKNGGRTPNGVANSSDMVGRNLMDHPQYLAWGLMPKPTAARPNTRAFPYRGPLVTSSIGEICDGPYRSHRAAFRVSLGNEGWNSLVGSGQFGPDPHVTAIDLVNGMNSSGLNRKEFTGLADNNRALFGGDLTGTLRDLVTRQFRIAFPVEQSPDPNNRVTLSTAVDALNLPRPKINYDISEYTRKGIATAFQMKNLIFKQLGAVDFTARAPGDPAGFDETIDGKQVQLTYGGAGHVMGTYRMGVDPKTSVVDSFQCSHDHPNLYLVGSGTFPTVGTSNPTITLSALALRTVGDIVLKLRAVKT